MIEQLRQFRMHNNWDLRDPATPLKSSLPDSCKHRSGAESKGLRAYRSRCFTQRHSHLPLNVSREVFETLLKNHDVTQDFLEVVEGFSYKDTAVEEALGFPFLRRWSESRNTIGIMVLVSGINQR